MIEREKVIKGFTICSKHGLFNGEDCHGHYESIDNMADIIKVNDYSKQCPYNGCRTGCVKTLAKDVLALLKEQEWNVLTEDADGVIHGLPGDDGKYLMTDGKDIWIDEYVDGVADGIILDSGRDMREITAWMYMPELPKQGRR